MSILIDTNVLLRVAQVTSQHHAIAKSAVLTLSQLNIALCIVPQVIYEFWVAATRPLNVNGLGMDVTAAERSVQGILQEFSLRKDERGIFGHWQTLVLNHAVQGKAAHDARLVAAMQRHGLTDILTFNNADFARFPTIRVFTPAEVLAGQLPVSS